MKMHTMPAWALECTECLRMLIQLLGARTLDEWRPLVAHLADHHREKLPPFVEGCSNCEEWQVSEADTAGTIDPHLVPILLRFRIEHQAGHLVQSELIETES